MSLHDDIHDRIAVLGNMALDETVLASIKSATAIIKENLVTGGKLITCGNGGSAALADHFVTEIVGRYKKDRRGYPAVSLSTNSTNTALANDFEYRQIFSRQLLALSQSSNDVLVVFTTSGESKNILNVLEKSKELKIISIAICGKNTQMLSDADIIISVDSDRTEIIQEVHQVIVHLLCDGIDSE